MKRDLPTTFQVRDDFGRIWPPGFESQLCDPGSPLTMLTNGRAAATAESARRGREVAAATGAGWGSGTIESMAKPGYSTQAPGMMTKMPQGQRRFAFRVGSSAAKAFGHLIRAQGNKLSDRALGELLQIQPYDVRTALALAVNAGVVLREPGTKATGKWIFWVPT